MSIQHIPSPEDIYHVHTAYCISRKHIACPHSIFYLQRTYSMSIQHIPCLQSMHTMSPEHTYSIHIHPRGSIPQTFGILTFSQIHPMTFGLCLGIITDTFHGIFEFSKNIFLSGIYFLSFFKHFSLK